ncbi:MAG: DUF4350 domain-containing protein [Verrucomicrobia bacterium]|nr:DUF4350 domain-containing protein [Verrucomicrobiota bacterium]
MAGVFLAGVYSIFQLRFQRGDIYPPYSTYRADPLGCKALYESLDTYEGMRARRVLEPFDELDDIEGSVFFNLGVAASPYLWERDVVADIRQFIHHGGRFVITFAPVTGTLNAWVHEYEEEADEDKDGDENEDKDGDEDGDKDADKDAGENKNGKVRNRFMKQSLAWGVTNVVLDADAGAVAMRTTAGDDLELPDSIPSRTRLAFGVVDEDWKALYTIDDHPVILERRIGDGTVVISSLSYVISNEAMKNDRHTHLLAWMVGRYDSAIFNEYIHGMIHRTGVAALARQYHLEPLFAGLLVLAALFIWRSVCPLVPPGARGVADSTRLGIATGRGSGSALVNLLRRNIPRQKVLAVCYQEWKRTRGHAGMSEHVRAGIADAIHEERAAPVGKRNPARAYNRLHKLLSDKPTRKETS